MRCDSFIFNLTFYSTPDFIHDMDLTGVVVYISISVIQLIPTLATVKLNDSVFNDWEVSLGQPCTQLS